MLHAEGTYPKKFWESLKTPSKLRCALPLRTGPSTHEQTSKVTLDFRVFPTSKQVAACRDNMKSLAASECFAEVFLSHPKQASH